LTKGFMTKAWKIISSAAQGRGAPLEAAATISIGSGNFRRHGTRSKKVATFVPRSSARDDNRAVHPVMSPMAATLWPAACSTDRISTDARTVLPAAI
jgi:hypothetical protein